MPSVSASGPAVGPSPQRSAAARVQSDDPSRRDGMLANVATTNGTLFGALGRDVGFFFAHPGKSLVQVVQHLAHPLLHPVLAAQGLAAGLGRDPVGTAVEGTSVVLGAAFVGSMVVAGAAVVAAPLTGGASLGVAAGALGFADALAVPSLVVDGTGIALHEARGALAPDPRTAAAEGEHALPFLEDLAFNAAAWGAGRALERTAPRSGANFAQPGSTQSPRSLNRT